MKSSTTIGVAKRSRTTFAKLLVGLLVGLVVGFDTRTHCAGSGGTDVSTTYPTVCAQMICPFPLPTIWPQSVPVRRHHVRAAGGDVSHGGCESRSQRRNPSLQR